MATDKFNCPTCDREMDQLPSVQVYQCWWCGQKFSLAYMVEFLQNKYPEIYGAPPAYKELK